MPSLSKLSVPILEAFYRHTCHSKPFFGKEVFLLGRRESPGHHRSGSRWKVEFERGEISLGIVFPPFLQDATSRAATLFNSILFRSRPAGAPLPKSGDSWSIAAIGDFGAGTKAQLGVARDVLAGQQELVLALGDMVYEKGLEAEYRKNFDPPERFGNIMKRFAVWPTVGNHDVAGGGVEPYLKRFPNAKMRRYYSFDHKNVRFFSLDSTEGVKPGTPQWQWLKTALSQAWNGWKIVFMHHPLRSNIAKRDRPAHEKELAALLALHGVSLIVVGHDHFYDRSKPLNDFGTVQITTGNGGRMLYPIVSKQSEWSARREVVHGHVNIEVREDALVVRHVKRGGVVTDTAIIKSSR